MYRCMPNLCLVFALAFPCISTWSQGQNASTMYSKGNMCARPFPSYLSCLLSIPFPLLICWFIASESSESTHAVVSIHDGRRANHV
ncbi:hypothetical protein BO82DRAFT_77946 [Aspergillus uvarum CBS 121591]|uniref:Secreted protein n=1 Tax=Aspergillus uvarum CBS 121591 TaxID=1448315 RepID=A0A319CBL7_9EURO|nr:hypothetical protein BO82DRAFT_77946 [Aspergillus uvarum CBS 121591]PYH81690.1 hypothetical protein BO82DRAFT_77946 [Aspergillus uvarum CBS 121591]